MYWNIYDTLSYNAMINFIVGMRGPGKTFGFKLWSINDYLKNNKQFYYIRRYKTELNKKKIGKFWADIQEKFPEHEFKVNTPNQEFIIDNNVAGFYMPLSTSITEKSVSTPNVNKICLDEFIIKESSYSYLPNEAELFLEACLTISRYRDVRIFLLANAAAINNPYFDYFNIHLPYGSKIYCKDDKLIELVDPPGFKETVKNTRFGKIISDTPYAQYAIENQFQDINKNESLIGRKSHDSRYLFTIYYQDMPIGVWIDRTFTYIYVSTDYDPSYKLVFSATLNDLNINRALFSKGSQVNIINVFRKYYKNSQVMFENPKLKRIFSEIMKGCY